MLWVWEMVRVCRFGEEKNHENSTRSIIDYGEHKWWPWLRRWLTDPQNGFCSGTLSMIKSVVLYPYDDIPDTSWLITFLESIRIFVRVPPQTKGSSFFVTLISPSLVWFTLHKNCPNSPFLSPETTYLEKQSTLPETNSSPLKIGRPKRIFISRPLIFRGENVSFREGI